MNGHFKIIPVLDLMGGIVVRGVRGERAKYKPVESKLALSAGIYDVAAAFNLQYGFRDFYIADLDAIISAGKRNQFDLLESLGEKMPGLSSMVDAGVHDAAGATLVLKRGATKAIVGTETLPSLEVWEEIAAAIPNRRLMASIDTNEEVVISASKEIARLSPAGVIRTLCSTGARECILLSLSKVGTGEGLNRRLILDCVDAIKEKQGELFFGGGVSCLEDLRWLASNGVAGALVASIFHAAPPDPEEIQNITGGCYCD